MKIVIEKNKCCGCSACANICPKGAITMQEDEKGFKYPVINQELCINCGLCQKICPVLNRKEEQVKRINAYACYNKNIDERLNSSSGGIFILIAKEIIKRNGVVFGATFDDNFNVIHSYAEKEEDLVKFMGSKYSQSDINLSYRKVKEFLENDRYVLFTGTPCQIEGLKSYLIKEYDKLYTQDIICHGVPSPKVWKFYLDYQKKINNENIKDISFRNKDDGWRLFNMKIKFNLKEYSKIHSKDLYMKAFLNNVCLREACYDCMFKKKYRMSDITLADYWGIDNIHPNLNDNNGTSLVIVNSRKGQELFELIKDSLIYENTDIGKAIKYNSSMIESVKKHRKRKMFFDKVNSDNFEIITNKYCSDNLIIRIKNKLKSIVKRIIKGR